MKKTISNMEKMELMDELQVHYKDFVKRMKGRVSYDDYETQSLLEGYTEELASFISKELDKAREEGDIASDFLYWHPLGGGMPDSSIRIGVEFEWWLL